MRPPAPWMAAKTNTPPNIFERKPGFMKKLPMMRPAIVVDTTDSIMRDVEPFKPLSRMFPYPMRCDARSKKTQATVNPMKWNAPGLKMKLRRVAISPMVAPAPGLRVHHKVTIRTVMPIMSHKMGRWVSCQKIGATIQLTTAQRAAEREMAARSRLSKYNIRPLYIVLRIFMIVTPTIKPFPLWDSLFVVIHCPFIEMLRDSAYPSHLLLSRSLTRLGRTCDITTGLRPSMTPSGAS